MTATLVAPSLDHWASFVEALHEGYKLTNTDAHIPEPPEKIAAIEADPATFLHDLANPPQTWTLPGGVVCHRPPQFLYWYVDGATFLGSGTLRLELPPAMAEWAGNVGYTVRPSARGKGYAVDILRQLMDRARDDHGLSRIEVCADVENLPSLRVIDKVGGEYFGLGDHLMRPGGQVKRYWLNLS